MNDIGAKIINYKPPRISMLLLVLAFTVHWLLPVAKMEFLTSPVLAVFVAITGFGVMIWAWWQFQQVDTAICPTSESTSLVISGVYRLTRNPMYLGMLLMMAGVALWLGTLPFYFVTGVYFLIIDQVFCPFEEERLEGTFGGEYLLYQKNVRRWL